MWSAAVRYRRFPLVSTGSAVFSVGGYALPALLLAQFYGAKTLGWYALSDRVLGVPIVLIGQAVSQVYSVEAAGFSNSNPQALRPLFFKLAWRLALLGAVPCTVFLALGPSLFAAVFGEGWREAGAYARLLAVAHYVGLIAWPLAPTLNILERQFWQLAWDAGRLVLTLMSLWLAHYLGYNAIGAITAFGIAMLVGYMVHPLLCHIAIRKRIDQSALGYSQSACQPELARAGKK